MEHDLDQSLSGEVGPVKFAVNGKDIITLVIMAAALGAMLWSFTAFLNEMSAALRSIKESSAASVQAVNMSHDIILHEVKGDHEEVMAACFRPATVITTTR